MCRDCWRLVPQFHQRNVGIRWRQFRQALLTERLAALGRYREALDLAVADVVARR